MVQVSYDKIISHRGCGMQVHSRYAVINSRFVCVTLACSTVRQVGGANDIPVWTTWSSEHSWRGTFV